MDAFYSPRSLKLKEMPYLCKKLGFKPVDDDTVTDRVGLGYNSKVLVGSWQAEREELNRVDLSGGKMEFETTYGTEYRGEMGTVDKRDLWNNRLHAMGWPDKGDERHRMATAYDLAFRCKVRDFVTGDYGNITGYGKKECLQTYWDATKNKDRSLRFHTEYRDAFSESNACLTHLIH